MGPNGRDKLMDELMSDYNRIMFAQQDPDYDSEMDFEGTYNTLAQAGV